jgi:hypothetical protein
MQQVVEFEFASLAMCMEECPKRMRLQVVVLASNLYSSSSVAIKLRASLCSVLLWSCLYF